MLVKDWMTKDVITLTADRSMMKAAKLMKDHKFKRIPIVDEKGRLVGIVSDRDVKAASPSKATSLDMHELYYLLSEVKINDIMTKSPACIHPENTVERAAVMMLKGKFGGLPVVDEGNHVVGIITDSDIFKVLISITGVREGGIQLGLKLSSQPGSLVPVLDFLKVSGARVVSILTSYDTPEEGTRSVFVRIRDMDKKLLAKLRAELEQKFVLLYWVEDPIDAD